MRTTGACLSVLRQLEAQVLQRKKVQDSIHSHRQYHHGADRAWEVQGKPSNHPWQTCGGSRDLTCIFLITLQAPDNRCLIRLLKTTSASTNLFTHVLPMHVMHILSGIDLNFIERVEDKLVLEWWKHNERTEFFNSSATAQAVRLCNKRTIVSDIDIE